MADDGNLGRQRAQRRYAVTNALTTAMVRQQLLRKQLQRGDSAEQVLAHCAVIEQAMERLQQAIQQLDDPSPDGADD